MDGHWAVMTDDKSYVKGGLNTRAEAIKCAGQIAAEGKFTFLMIHSDRHFKKSKAPH
jgi:hypothetical protein